MSRNNATINLTGSSGGEQEHFQMDSANNDIYDSDYYVSFDLPYLFSAIILVSGALLIISGGIIFCWNYCPLYFT